MTNTSPAAVDRYDLTYDGLVHDSGGDFVKYEDYAALSSQLEAANQRHAAALDALTLAKKRADALVRAAWENARKQALEKKP